MLLVYRYRIKSLTGLLSRQARACNVVWNFCNETQQHALKWNKPWPSGFDLNRLTAGSSGELDLHSGTINAVCEQYAKSRRQKNRPFLRWRGRRSLGWVPLKGRDLRREGEAFRFAGNTFRVFHSRPLPEGKITLAMGTDHRPEARLQIGDPTVRLAYVYLNVIDGLIPKVPSLDIFGAGIVTGKAIREHVVE